jgi:hypothetical protein
MWETGKRKGLLKVTDKETATGTVVLRPKDADPSDSVNMNLDAAISFVEKIPSLVSASVEQED